MEVLKLKKSLTKLQTATEEFFEELTDVVNSIQAMPEEIESEPEDELFSDDAPKEKEEDELFSDDAPEEEPKEEKTKTKKTFDKKHAPKGDAETTLFLTQWNKLSQDQQELYLKGEINSHGKVIADAKNDRSTAGRPPKKVTRDELKDALQSYAKANGRDKTLKIMKKFKAKNLSDIDEKDYAKVMKLVKK